MRHATRVLILSLFACAAPVTLAQTTPPVPPDASADKAEIKLLKDQIQLLRQQVAEMGLKIDKLDSELKQRDEFLATKDLDERFAKWQTERTALEEERLRVRRERYQLENARKALHQETYTQAQQQADDQDEARKQAEEAAKPRWSVQYMLGFIDKDQQRVYVDNYDGDVIVRTYPDIDRHNIMIRGTFLNRSTSPWRYTFVINLLDDKIGTTSLTPNRQLGQWRYQTPLLGPGDLDTFEIKVPVTNAKDVDGSEITDMTADQPTITIVPVPVTKPDSGQAASGTATVQPQTPTTTTTNP